ncbi:MAG: hypothetical protein M3508_09235 [Actinomycetota bacterium]|nr:hypothetical protein [Actinomycetota bacterium]
MSDEHRDPVTGEPIRDPDGVDSPPPPPPAEPTSVIREERHYGSETAPTHGATRADDDDDDRDVMTVDAGDRKPSYGLGSLLALLAALAIAVSTFLNWAKENVVGPEAYSGLDLSTKFLWDIDTRFDDPSLLFVLLPAAILVLIGSFVPRLRWMAILGGAATIAAAVIFIIQVGQALPENSPDGALDFIDIGVWVAAAGGLLAIIGSLIIPRRPAELR